MSLVLMLVPFFPATGIVVRVGFVIAERWVLCPWSCAGHLTFYTKSTLGTFVQSSIPTQHGILPASYHRS